MLRLRLLMHLLCTRITLWLVCCGIKVSVWCSYLRRTCWLSEFSLLELFRDSSHSLSGWELLCLPISLRDSHIWVSKGPKNVGLCCLSNALVPLTSIVSLISMLAWWLPWYLIYLRYLLHKGWLLELEVEVVEKCSLSFHKFKASIC